VLVRTSERQHSVWPILRNKADLGISHRRWARARALPFQQLGNLV
jgi:hypothetical protein